MHLAYFKAAFAGFLLLLPVATTAVTLDCSETISPACGNTPNAAFDHHGRLWVAFEQQGRVYVTSSNDLGLSFSDAVAVNALAEPIYAKGENRPKLAHGSKGELFVSWTQKLSGRFTGEIRFSRSLDNGKSFKAPMTVNDDGLQTSHRFDALHVTPSGKIFLSWLDKRDKMSRRTEGQDYHGAALYYAVSEDGGASFNTNIKVADHSCECCRIAIGDYRQDEVAVMWRHIYEGSTRDHALAILGTEGHTMLTRATVDDWQVNACPHHGPDIALSTDGEYYHVAWFSNGTLHKGLYYDRLIPGSSKSGNPISIDARFGASHPQVAVNENTVFLLWKYFDGQETKLKLMRSSNNGDSWSEPETVLVTSGASDHPQLLQHGGNTYAGWQTGEEGYRLAPVR